MMKKLIEICIIVIITLLYLYLIRYTSMQKIEVIVYDDCNENENDCR